MLAVMGPSGSGKTTLLNILSAKLHGDYTGSVLINGQVADKQLMKRVAGFVPQEDILFGSQTVREALKFYADLKLPTTLSEATKNEMVEYILEELGLKKVENSLIGYVGADALTSGLPRGLSGGERKRLSIGCQLISNPSILFLDEPTTGLDSFASESVVQTLSKLAMQGRTIIFTIHQPSMEVLSLFDRLLLLGRGRTVYFGPNAQMLDYFASIGYECPEWENPANFIMDTIHGHFSHNEHSPAANQIESSSSSSDSEVAAEAEMEEVAVGAEKSHDRYENALQQALLLADKFSENKMVKTKVKKAPPPVPSTPQKHQPGFGRIINVIVTRQFKHLWREPSTLRASVFQTIFVALIMGLIYLRMGHTNTDLADRTGAHFFAVVFMAFVSILAPFYNFGTERKIFLFQHQDGLVSTSAFYVGKLVAETPMFLVTAMIWSVIYYWMANFKPGAGPFFLYWFIIVVTINISFAYGMLIVNAVPNPQVAIQVFPLLFMPLLIFSGFYLNRDNTPKYFIWVEYVSYAKYAFHAIMRNEFGNVSYHCKTNELINVAGNAVCPYTSGNSWLDYFHMRDFPIYGDLLILIELTILYHIISYVLLRRTAKSSSN
jgi:ABC-type multidrug transport system ATPase subunit